jgi:hypothetical protein
MSSALLKAGNPVLPWKIKGVLAGAPPARWTPLMFTSALLRYNSSNNAISANVRLRWEYRPGSELFVVYNKDRDTLARRFPALSPTGPSSSKAIACSTVISTRHTLVASTR